jgi:uridine kinase
MSGTAIRHDNYTLAKPSKVIISEGLFTLTDKVKDAFNFKIYVDIPEELKRERFFVRAEERGLGDSAEHIYANANSKAEVHIRPCKECADIILSGAADRILYKNFLNKIIGIVQELYFTET